MLDVLKKNHCSAYTITNHNNARSCFEQQDRGVDILTGAEFSCLVPDFHVGIHVLAYGFSPAQEGKLNKLRKNLYDFLEFTVSHDLPTIWAHPLYHYSSNGIPPMSFFNKMCLVFELPSEIRSYMFASGKERKSGTPDLEKLLDGLSFPFFATTIILAAHFTSARVMYHAREMLRQFSMQTGKLKHPERIIWLTDTFDDKNGVSMVLQAMHLPTGQFLIYNYVRCFVKNI